MDLTTSLAGVIGLALEIFGLSFLFFELLRSKRANHREDAIGSFKELLEGNAIDLQINTHKLFAGVVRSMQKLSEMRAGPITDALWREFSTSLKTSCDSLPSLEQIGELEARKTVATAETLIKFKAMHEEHQRLRRIATIGIAFVLAGAGLQIADLTIL